MNRIQIEIFDCETGEKIYNSLSAYEFYHPNNKQHKIEVPEFIQVAFQSFLRGVVFSHRSISISVSSFPLSDNQPDNLFDDVY